MSGANDVFHGEIAFSGTANEYLYDGEVEFSGSSAPLKLKRDLSIVKTVTEKEGEDGTYTYQLDISSKSGTGEDIALNDTITLSDPTAEIEISNVAVTPAETAHNVTASENTISGTLPALTAGESYTVTYDVKVTNYGSLANDLTMTNQAFLKAGDLENNSDEVVTTVSGALITKAGEYNSYSNRVTWTVTISNPNGNDLNGQKLTDNFVFEDGKTFGDYGMQLVKDSFTVAMDGVDVTESYKSGLNTAPASGLFEYTFPAGSTGKEYVITYMTNVGTYSGELTNSASFEGSPSVEVINVSGKPTPGVVKNTEGRTLETTDTGDPNIKKLFWFVQATLDIKDPTTVLVFTDKIQDVTVGGKAYDDTHYTTVKELTDNLAAARYGLHVEVDETQNYVSLDKAGLTYKLECFSDTNLTDLVTDDNAHVKSFRITITAVDKTQWINAFRVRFYYNTFVDTSKLPTTDVNGDPYTWKIVNGFYDQYGNRQTSGTHNYTPQEKNVLTKNRVTFNDSAFNNFGASQLGSLASNTTTAAPASGYLYYRITLYPDWENIEAGQITITDTLSPGLSIPNFTSGDVNGTVAYRVYLVGDKLTSQANISASKRDNYATFTKVSGDATSGETWNITINDWTGDPTYGSKTGIVIIYRVKIADDVWDSATPSAGEENKSTLTYQAKNSASWNGQTATVDTGVTKEVDTFQKTGDYTNIEDPTEIRYRVVINAAGADLDAASDQLVLSDQLVVNGSTQVVAYLQTGSVTLRSYDWQDPNAEGQLLSNYSVQPNADGKGMTITVPDETPCVLEYSYTIWPPANETGITVDNSITLNGQVQVSKVVNVQTVQASLAQKGFTVNKVDNENIGTSLAGAVFTLSKYTGSGFEVVQAGLTSDSTGSVGLTGALGLASQGKELYNTLLMLVETKAPSGYKLDPTPHYFVLLKDSDLTKVATGDIPTDQIITYGEYGGVMNIGNKKTLVSIQKLWKDANGNALTSPPTNITVQIRKAVEGQDDQFTTVTLTKDEGWYWDSTKATNDLTTADQLAAFFDGEGTYTVTETTVGGVALDKSGYTVTYTVGGSGTNVISSNGAITITNKYEPQTIDIPVEKSWDDANNQDGKRPESITVKLQSSSSEEPARTLTLYAAKNWKGTFTGLMKYDSKGNEIVYTVQETNVPEGYTSSIQRVDENDITKGVEITNTHIPETVSIPVTKVWDDDNDRDNIRPDSITVQLLANGEDTGKTLTLDASNGWAGSFTDLPKYKEGEVGVAISYTVKESGVPSGYTVAIAYDATTGYTITNSYTPDKTSVSVTKVWNDNDDQDGKRPVSITVQLLANGEDTGKTLTLDANNGWAGSFTDLPKNADGAAIDYTVKETGVPSGYTVSTEGNMTDGFTITNSYTPATISITGSKTWEDDNNRDGKRPESITIRLWSDKEADAEGKPTQVAEKTVTAEDGWRWSFTDLPKYADGAEIRYSITEDTVENYSTGAVTGNVTDGFTVTNRYNPGKTSVSVAKVWADDGNRDNIRPASITVKLLANGADTGKTLTLNEGNGWKGSFTDLHVNENGVAIEYTVEESGVPTGYTVRITGDAATGYTITNTHQPETIQIPVTKKWEDDNDRDGKRPENITIRIYADGSELKDLTVTVEPDEEGNWSHTFTGLPKYRDGGEEIQYTISEDGVKEYETKLAQNADGDVTKGFTVTNTHAPETIEVSGSKVWDDKDDQDGKRPESITIRLWADGMELTEYATTVKADEDGKWTWSFKGLPKYKEGLEGVPVTYTITEDKVEEYSTEISGSMDKGFTVTNSYTPSKTSVTVTKAWDDGNDWDGIRPRSIIVKLLANGEDTGKTLKLRARDNWQGAFTELDEYANGEKIEYTIQEISVSGYSTKITGTADSGYMIVNHHTPDYTTNPHTGDSANLPLWLGLGAASLAAAAGLSIWALRKKRKSSR